MEPKEHDMSAHLVAGLVSVGTPAATWGEADSRKAPDAVPRRRMRWAREKLRLPGRGALGAPSPTPSPPPPGVGEIQKKTKATKKKEEPKNHENDPGIKHKFNGWNV